MQCGLDSEKLLGKDRESGRAGGSGFQGDCNDSRGQNLIVGLEGRRREEGRDRGSEGEGGERERDKEGERIEREKGGGGRREEIEGVRRGRSAFGMQDATEAAATSCLPHSRCSSRAQMVPRQFLVTFCAFHSITTWFTPEALP